MGVPNPHVEAIQALRSSRQCQEMANCQFLILQALPKCIRKHFCPSARLHASWHMSRYRDFEPRSKAEGPMKLFLVMLGVVAGAYWIWPRQAVAEDCPGSLMSQDWTECRTAVLNACAFVSPGESRACEATAAQRYVLTQQIAQRTAVSPVSPWLCPTSHPIKGNFTTYNGERCIFHSPGGQFYEKTKPEKCYANPAEAIADGCRASLR